MKEKINKLVEIYAAFDQETRQYRSQEACGKGCSLCCSHAGSIDITTLEGLAIQTALEALPVPVQKTLKCNLRQETRHREKLETVPCPFLLKTGVCTIYDARPFSCRRITSLHACSTDRPPELHRQVMALADKRIHELQRMDDTGYSGHISFVLGLLDTQSFRRVYLGGDFRPRDIMDYGKTHRIFINRMVS